MTSIHVPKRLFSIGICFGIVTSCLSAQNLVTNGGFENGFGSGNVRNFEQTANWFNFGTGGQTQAARRNDEPQGTGSFIGQINDRYDAVNATSDFDPSAFGPATHSNKTNHVIASGETYSFSLDWQDRFNWNDGLDEVRFVFFATNDDTLGGDIVWTSTHDSGISISQNGAEAAGDFQNFSGTSELVTPAAVGRTLFVSVFGFQNDGALSAKTGFAGIDNVSVTVDIPESGTYGLLGGLVALGLVVVRRR